MCISRTVVLVWCFAAALSVWSGLQAGQDMTAPWGRFAQCGPAEDPRAAPVSSPGEPRNRVAPSGCAASPDMMESTLGARQIAPLVVAQRSTSTGTHAPRSRAERSETIWRSDEIDMLAVGIGVGDLDGDGKNEVVVADPNKVYLYRLEAGKLHLVTDYSAGTLELKSIDVAKIRMQGPPRIYVSAQNRGSVSSFVLDYTDGKLVPVIQESPYFLRIIMYPTQGPILLGQRKGLSKMYEGPVYRLTDKGDALETEGRFGVPLKIPVFGFAIGDLVGNRNPLIAVYDRSEHLRIYEPSGKRVYVSKDYYGGSDIVLRWGGPERSTGPRALGEETEVVFFRPRIMSLDLEGNRVYEVLVLSHESKTRRFFSHTRMLEEGRVEGLVWNGDALEQRWTTPKIQGIITDFAVDHLPGLEGLRLITLERKKTDWFAFLSSKSQIRAYDIRSLMEEGAHRGSRRERD